jgi:hypothetical protein
MIISEVGSDFSGEDQDPDKVGSGSDLVRSGSDLVRSGSLKEL